MNVGPTGYNRESRDYAVRVWLSDVAQTLRSGKLWGRWRVFTDLRDAYDRGYIHGYQDKGDDDAAHVSSTHPCRKPRSSRE